MTEYTRQKIHKTEYTETENIQEYTRQNIQDRIYKTTYTR